MIDTPRLRVLREVARQGSFSGAATAFGYTQPAVSRQVAALEAEVGTLLVRRLPRGVVLTEAGQLLLTRAESILAGLDSVEDELRALAGLQGGRLRLASFASAAATIVPPAIAQFRQRYPAVELRVVMADPDESLPRLRAGDLDIALSHDPLEECAVEPDDGYGPPGSTERRGGVELVHLFDDPMYVAMHPGHPLARRKRLKLASFAQEPWMLSTTNSCPDSRLFLKACREAGIEPRIALQNDDYPAILGFVAARVGVALIPDMAARGIREDVVIRELEPPSHPRSIFAALPAAYRSPAAAAMLEILSDVSHAWVAERPAVAALALAA